MPELLGPAERALLRLVLNRLVPADGPFPAAGSLGVGMGVEQLAGNTPAARRLLVEGLRQIAMAGEQAHPEGFAALTDDQRDAVLERVEREHPAFFETLVRQTYAGYYSDASVLKLLGEDAPPQPRGHRVDPMPLGLVERVRRSAFTYRQP